MALSTAIFPILFGRAAAGDSGGYARTLLRAVKTVLLVALKLIKETHNRSGVAGGI
ncbi:hypothetical protein [Desulfofundulus thermosubterraneus]|uniref:Putative peptidoglycan lipid II flippase n=1 Tax=Desulfofundulus thermosubterraneus DSM 16057 TaxID=1121432 RepID=A0A1M6MZQ5_9FIRM|nr:hypothetical protein [Desulfofundulus thermosubterraneus]SHJ88985.1 putative peptidoglycan lipid II flippase [Desulfofundulus thermosubterraneus DSM 16057]